jgi:hypothetical protein
MRIEPSATSLSWIPYEAIKGMTKLPFERSVTHYDEPPPDVIFDLEALRRADRFRFANELRAWIDVEVPCSLRVGPWAMPINTPSQGAGGPPGNENPASCAQVGLMR